MIGLKSGHENVVTYIGTCRILTNVIRTDQHGSMQTAALHSPDIRHLSLYMYILKHVLACPREREGEREGESI